MSWFQGRRNAGHASLGVQSPLSRREDLIVEEVDDEVLVYDQRTDRAHCLSGPAARVWQACDGRTGRDELGAMLELDPDTVARAIDELESCDLLDAGPAVGVTRRQATAKFAKVGAAAASAPLIYSIMAPTPALAASQAFCLSIGCVNSTNGQSQGGCGACHNCGCACCGPSNPTSGGVSKLCTADCSPTFCTSALLQQHCGTNVTSPPCNQGGGGGSCHHN